MPARVRPCTYPIILSIYSLIFCFTAIAQDTLSDASHSLNFFPNSRLKARIELKDNRAVIGTITRITDSIVSISPWSQNRDTSVYNNIAIEEIQLIKIKRNAFWLGMGCGAVASGLAGYVLGSITYKKIPYLSENNNKDNQMVRGMGGAVIAAVPGAIIGSVAGTVGFKRKFIVNGDINSIRKMIKALWEFQ